MNIVKLARYAMAGWLPGGRCRCAMCGHRIWRYMPYRDGFPGVPALMRALGIVGSNPDDFECPRCGSHDRERHLLLYLEAMNLLVSMRGRMVVHFAPEPRLARRIAGEQPAHYVRCDLYPRTENEERVDILDMQFETGSVDFLIANHVLEHVADDMRALTEICRVLKPGGHAILQTPYSRKLHRTWQDEGISDNAARLQAYGQEDHVRLYGRDIFNRFASTGLVSQVRQHADLLPGIDVATTGVNPDEPFFLFRKPR